MQKEGFGGEAPELAAPPLREGLGWGNAPKLAPIRTTLYKTLRTIPPIVRSSFSTRRIVRLHKKENKLLTDYLDFYP